MRSIDDLVQFCKRQSVYHNKKAAEQNLKPEWAAKHRDTVSAFTDLMVFLEATPLLGLETPKDPVQGDLFTLDPFRLEDIPAELLEELKISKADKVDAEIVELLKIASRPLTISEVLIGLYRKFSESHKRTALSARLYRMKEAGILEQVEGERGTYNLADTQREKPAS